MFSLNNNAVSLRVEEIRREIAQIRAANRRYLSYRSHSQLDMGLHETRRRRLQEIVIELTALSRKAA